MLLDNIYFLYFDIIVLAPVEDQRGEMGRYQSVDSAAGPRQVRGAVGQTGPETARQHARHVDHQHLRGKYLLGFTLYQTNNM